MLTKARPRCYHQEQGKYGGSTSNTQVASTGH